MKIRFLLNDVYGAGGGVVTVTLALAGELAQRHDVEILSLFGKPPAVHPLPEGVRIRHVARRRDKVAALLPRNRRAARRPSRMVPPLEPRYEQYSEWTDRLLTRRLRRLKGGALVVMQPGLSVVAAQVAPQGCIVVAQDHRPFDRRARRIQRAYRRHAEGLSAFLTLTRTDARLYRRFMRGKVSVRALPNGLPPYAGPRSDHQARIVVAAGRLFRSKGFDVLVDAWATVAASQPDWHLEIWGEGAMREELLEQIRSRGLEGRVHLRGFSSRLQQEMARASIFVLSSRAEGYPRVILEARACALPVVSTDCPSGPREMITPGVDGVLVEPEDPDALAAGILELIEGGVERRRELGLAGLALVEEQSQAVIAERWERLLLRLERERARK